jgi:hypothetical protein
MALPDDPLSDTLSPNKNSTHMIKPLLFITVLLAAACNPPPEPPPTRFTPRPPLPPQQVDPYGQPIDPNAQTADPYGQSADPYGNAPQTTPPPPPVRPGEYPSATRTANPNEVISPYEPFNIIDVEGLRSGQLARDPYNKKIFRVP